MVPSGWEVSKLETLMTFKNGLNAEKENYGHGIKFVNVMDIFADKRLYEERIIGLVNASDKQIDDYSVRYGDVLLNRTSETFEEIAFTSVYLDEKPITFGGFVIRARPKGKYLDPEYSVYCFHNSSVRKEFIRRAQGAVRANIGQKDLNKIQIVLPPLPEQTKIAQLLSTWDKAIATVEKLIENSKQQKKALMQQLLTGKKRFKEFGQPAKDGELPEGWEVKTIGDICEVKGGKRLPKGSNLVDKDTGFPYIRVADMYQGGVSLDDIKFVPKGVAPAISRYIINTDDIFITVAGTLGIIGEIPRVLDGANLTENADKLTNIKINRKFLLWVMQSEIVQRKIESERTTNAQPKLALTRIKSFKIPVPGMDEQIKISEILDNSMLNTDMLNERLVKIKQEKKSLMQQLLTGKRRVKVDAPQPASTETKATA